MYYPIDVFFVSQFSNSMYVTPEINTTHDAKFSQIGKHQPYSERTKLNQLFSSYSKAGITFITVTVYHMN